LFAVLFQVPTRQNAMDFRVLGPTSVAKTRQPKALDAVRR
jgi:hypothetical protein